MWGVGGCMRPNVYVGGCICTCQCAYGGHRIPLCGVLPQLQHALFFETVSPLLARLHQVGWPS